MKAPCMDCKDRHLGCHSECAKYKDFKAAKDEENEKTRARKKAVEDYYICREYTHERLKHWDRKGTH